MFWAYLALGNGGTHPQDKCKNARLVDYKDALQLFIFLIKRSNFKTLEQSVGNSFGEGFEALGLHCGPKMTFYRQSNVILLLNIFEHKESHNIK